MKLGFIGLGNMGGELARHFLAAGHSLTVTARGERSRTNATRLGLKPLATPAAVAAASDVVFTMVTAGTDVEAVALGMGGIAEGARPGALLIDLSTISPLTARDIAARLGARGVAMVDAPVSGGVAAAKTASLTIFAGGDPADVARAKPLLEHIGKNIFHMG
ncbi:MAG: NAD(P)-dependent oxidoreductase, partial [Gammaproteobacteria bacterium]|nr:NAD(P)-dependent oxidoreductase [Gammaproteobacteria bacterium]